VTGQLRHMAQLDGLRAIAVSAVLVHHFGSTYFSAPSPAGAMAGVKLFFVLSGFLITSILLIARDRVRQGNSSRSNAMKTFYVRRVLRIFPLYYLVVLLSIAIDAGPAREVAWWLLSHTLNFKMAAQGWFVALYSHFWSLNVEEQFYLVWPWVVIFLPDRWLMPAVIATIAVTPLGKIAYFMSGYTLTSGIGTFISTWACLDSLGMGALVALLRHRGSSLTGSGGSQMAAALTGLGIFLALPYLGSNAELFAGSTAQALAFAGLILAAATGFKGPMGAALQSRPAVFVGKISYGIYVYHQFVPGLLAYLWLTGTGSQMPVGWIGLSASVAATLVLSTVSWFTVEKPLLGLKERFQ